MYGFGAQHVLKGQYGRHHAYVAAKRWSKLEQKADNTALNVTFRQQLVTRHSERMMYRVKYITREKNSMMLTPKNSELRNDVHSPREPAEVDRGLVKA